jgi:anti-sigma factor RsiW
MAPREITDEDLMAYADGEANAATEQRIDAALAEDDTLAARLAAFLDSREAVHAAFAPKLQEPVPEALLAAVQAMAAKAAEPAPAQGNVVSLDAHRQARRSMIVPGAMAAAIVLGLGFVVGQAWGPTGGNGTSAVAALADPSIQTALSTVPTGDEEIIGQEATFRAIASFRDVDGAFCREFEHARPEGDTYVSVACDTGEDWAIKLVIATGSETGYAPASALETLDAWMVSTEAQAPMSSTEEMEALGEIQKKRP